MGAPQVPRTLVLACGALARELRDIVGLHQLENVSIECLPAELHNTPGRIPAALRHRLERVRGRYDRILIGYGDCGTAGEIDTVCADEGVERIPGAHCYEFFAGGDRFTAMHDTDPTAFYLTDFLVKHFDRIVMRGLGITDHPELRDAYFGNYTKVIHLAQTDDAELDRRAEEAAAAIGLAHERLATGYGDLEETVVNFAAGQKATA